MKTPSDNTFRLSALVLFAFVVVVLATSSATSVSAESTVYKPLLLTATPTPAQQPVYNTTFLTDAQLRDADSMTADQIRAFLANQGSFYQRPVTDVDGVTFDPPEVIAQAAAKYQISPKVLLATLQKESSAVTSGRSSNMSSLMGCGADVTLPEPANTARGQFWCAAQKFDAYQKELDRTGATRSGWRVGVRKETQDGVIVTPATKAVAGQFTYTPYAGTSWSGVPVCNGGSDPCGGVYLFYDAWQRLGFGQPISNPNPSSSTRVGIEAGHSSTDPGSPSCDKQHDEAEVTFEVAKHLKRLLERRGYVVDLFRDNKNEMQAYKADAFVSLHNDWCAPGATGYKVSRYEGEPGTGLNGSGDASDRLIQALWDEYGKVTGLPQDRSAGHFTLCMTHYFALNPVNGGLVGVRRNGSCELEPNSAYIDASTPGAVIEMGWWSGDEDALLNRQEELAQGIAAGINAFLEQSVGPPQNSAGTATVFVTDVSGSMGDPWQGGVKIESAKSAATQLLTILERESQTSGLTHEAALVPFSTNAALELPLTSDHARARDVVSQMQPLANTNIGAGLEIANEELQNASPDAQKIIILLSDGLSNEGLPPGEIVAGPARAAGQAGTCLYTVGFGDPGDLDEDLLRRIADESPSDCGGYYPAGEAFELENVYVTTRHEATGDIVAQVEGEIAQGETASVGTFGVPPNKGELNVTLNWPGSRLDLLLRDPQGQEVDNSYPGATIFANQRPVQAIVENPQAGDWSAEVVGTEVDEPQGVTTFNFVASTRGTAPPTPIPPPPPDTEGEITILSEFVRPFGGELLMMFAILAIAGGAGWLLYQHNLSHGAGLVRLDGSGGFEPIRGNTFTIGRGRQNHLTLPDQQVSGRHAIIRRQGQDYVLYDDESTNGTYVNGTRIQQHRLRDGDEIRIGSIRLRFRA